MELENRRALKSRAADALNAAQKPRRLAAIYAGGIVILSLVVTLLSLWLGEQMEGTGGLSNFGTRAVLETVQTVLPYGQLLLMLCLEMGFLRAMMRIGRGQSAGDRELLSGFSLLGPVLRAALLQGLIYVCIGMTCVYLGSAIFMFTPYAEPLIALMEPLVADPTLASVDEATLMAMLEATVPAMVISFLLFAVVAMPIAYRYRMVNFCLLEDPRAGALAAMRASRNMMRGNRWKLAKLDLSFWWFYGLMLLAAVLSFGSTLLTMLGVTLPVSTTVSVWLFYGLHLAATFGVYYFAYNQVSQTYFMAYEAIRPRPQTGGVVLGNIFQM